MPICHKYWASHCGFDLYFPDDTLNTFSCTCSVQSLSRVLLVVTPWITAHQASLSITNSQSLTKLMSIESVMPSSHLILCCPLLLLPQSLPASESFPMSQLFPWGGQSIGVSASASVLETNRDHSVVFEIASKYCISDSFVDYDGCSISSKGFLCTVVDIMVLWIKFTIPVHFSSLIPKMSMLTLAMSCWTTSNLPWFMDPGLQGEQTSQS